MISVKFDDKAFIKTMNNIMEYSIGYTDGIQKGKRVFLNNLGMHTKELVKEFIDSQARVDPASLHHVYEWYAVGSPSARLFDIDYTVSNLGLSFKSSFSQSQSVKSGSREPFYNKATVMENGQPVTIRPKTAQVLVFEVDGETVFTKGPVRVNNPGGDSVEGGFKRAFDMFFNVYFAQSFFQASGLRSYLERPTLYSRNFGSGSRGGYPVGLSTGYRWIANAGGAVV